MPIRAKYIFYNLSLVVFIIFFGTFGYYFIEDNWSLEDAFYMASITITTVGFGEVHPLSQEGRYFTILLILMGFGAVAYMGTQLARLVIDIELKRFLERKTMRRKILELNKHYIICGYGRIGRTVSESLSQQRVPFVIIEDKDEEIKRAEENNLCVVPGNATTDNVLLEAGVERASGVICVLKSDADNLFIALSVRELNPRIFIVARGEGTGVEDKILRAGADIVVSPLQLGGQQIANLVCQNRIEDPEIFCQSGFNSVRGLSLHVFRVSTFHKTETVKDAIKELDALTAVEVQREDGTVENMPSLDFPLHIDDVVILLLRDQNDLSEIHRVKIDGKVVLIADDHRALRRLFAKKITAAGHETITAATGGEAMKMVIEKTPDLVVLDIMMPVKNGYEVCEYIKQSEHLKHIPVILYSGDESAEFYKRGAEVGANICIQKTSKSSELLLKIEELLNA